MSQTGAGKPPVTLLGFDFGSKRIGVATGQTITGSVSALTTLNSVNGQPDWQTIGKLITEWQPDLLIVGLPLNMDGTDTRITPTVRRFGNQLKGRYNLPVEMVDERLTSVEARSRLHADTSLRHKRFDREQVDQIAAQVIVQSWLTQLQQDRGEPE
ncbi:MAG: Holliday junction resolvase RuvX [Gammaproteobacteria bacterium]